MATATNTAPIGIGQINTTFYVMGGGVGFSTIQVAVNYVRTQNSSVGIIEICHGHDFNDNISTVTGGVHGIYLLDRREAQTQQYVWNGTQYVFYEFFQASGGNFGWLTVGELWPTLKGSSMMMGYDPIAGPGAEGAGAIYSVANAGKGMPRFHLGLCSEANPPRLINILQAYPDDPDAPDGYIHVETTGMWEFTTDANPAAKNVWFGEKWQTGAKGLYVHALPGNGVTDFQAWTVGGAYNQGIRLNPHGGAVTIGTNAEVSTLGDMVANTYTARGLWPTLTGSSIQMGYDVNAGPNQEGAGALIAVANAGKGIPRLHIGLCSENDPPSLRYVMQMYPDPADNITRVDATGRWNFSGPGDVSANTYTARGIWPTLTGASIQMGYDVTAGPNQEGAGGIIVAAEPTKGYPALNFGIASGDGRPLIYLLHMYPDDVNGFIRCEAHGRWEFITNTAPDTPNIWVGERYQNAAKGLYIHAVAADNIIDFQGQTAGGAKDQTIRLNPNGGNVIIGPSLEILGTGDVHVTGDVLAEGTITSNTAIFSPNGGFTNTLQAGYLHSTADILAEGQITSHTGVFSNNGTFTDTLQAGYLHATADLTVDGNATVAGSPVRTFANSPDGGGTMIWPPAGVAVSTGSAWGTSIAQANIALLNAANTFTANQSINAILNFNGNLRLGNRTAQAPWNSGTANISSDGSGIYINSSGTGPIVFNYDQGTGGVGFYNGATGQVASIDVAGNLHTTGTILANGGTISLGTRLILWDVVGHPAQPTNCNIGGDGSNIFINPSGDQSLYLNWQSGAGSGGTAFGDGVGTLVGRIDKTGNATFNGTITAGINIEVGAGGLHSGGAIATDGGFYTAGGAASINSTGNAIFVSLSVSGAKSFVVPHPLDDTKDLRHSCLEGPENGVYYRGEVVTANGTAEVTLPDYFEALTFTEDRSVQLTQVFETGAVLTMLAASRVVDGKFTVQSSAPVATVAWEVKAVRRIGVDRLEVATAKQEPPTPTQAVEEVKEESTNERKQRRANRL